MVEFQELKRRIELYFLNKVITHIETFEGRYYNGLILEMGSDFIFMHERILGKTFILLSQISVLESYKGGDSLDI